MKWFVYEHWRPDKDVCFYVGKGQGRRAHKMSSRNCAHVAVQRELAQQGLCVEVRLVAGALAEEAAFALECERIAFWRSAGVELANISSGGEGASGFPAWNRRAVICLEDGNVFATVTSAAMAYGLLASTVSQACREVCRPACGLHFIFVDEMGDIDLSDQGRAAAIRQIESVAARRRKRVAVNQHHGSISSGKDARGRSARGPASLARPVICLDDEKTFSSASEAARHYNVGRSAIIELCLGKRGRKTVGGLRFEYGDA